MVFCFTGKVFDKSLITESSMDKKGDESRRKEGRDEAKSNGDYNQVRYLRNVYLYVFFT